MNQRNTIVLVIAVVVFFTSAALIYGTLVRHGSHYSRKTVAGVECLVDGNGKPVSCNWRS